MAGQLTMRLTALQRAVRAKDWPAQALPVNGVAAPTSLFSGPALLRGWNLENFSATSTDVSINDGDDASGKFVAYFHMTSAANNGIWIGGPGLIMEIGIWLGTLSQALKGAVWYTPLDDRQLDALLREHGHTPAVAPHGKGN